MAKILRHIRLDKNTFRFLSNLRKHIAGNFKKKKDSDIPYPTTLMLELTNRCNLHCVTCPREYGYGKKMKLGEMETGLAKKIIDEALPYTQSIGLTGMGETLFAPNLVEIARYIKERKPGVLIFISTNANMPDFEARIRPVLPYIDTVQISTDGIGEGYERIRHGGSFSLLEKNLKTLTELNDGHCDVMFNMVITKLNYRDMPGVIRFAAANGVRFVNFTYINLASLTDTDIGYYDFFSSKEFQSVLAMTKDEADRHPEVEVTGLDFQGNPGIRKCPLMWNHFQINHDGEMPPCCAKPFTAEYSFGNVGATSLLDTVNSDKAKRFRNHWIDNRPHPFCEKCHFINL